MEWGAIAAGTPAALAPSTSQLRTPPRPVRLVTVPKGPVAAQTIAVTSPSSPVPQTPIISMRQIQDKTPQTLTNIKQPSNTTATAPVWKAAIVAKRKLRSKAQLVATCQILGTIEEVNEDSQVYPDFDFGETESEGSRSLWDIRWKQWSKCRRASDWFGCWPNMTHKGIWTKGILHWAPWW